MNQADRMIGEILRKVIRGADLMPEFREEIREGHDAFLARRTQKMKDAAEADPEYQLRCIFGEKPFYSEDDRARMPGHVYSEAGIREFAISSCCEFHFDKMFASGSEDEDV